MVLLNFIEKFIRNCFEDNLRYSSDLNRHVMTHLIFNRFFTVAGFLIEANAAAIITALLTCIAVFAGMLAGAFLGLVRDVNFSL